MVEMVWVALAVACAFLFGGFWWLFYRKPLSTMRHFEQYPYFKAMPFHPVLGNVVELQNYKDESIFMNFWLDPIKKLGPNYVLSFFYQPFVIMSQPEVFNDIFTPEGGRHYHKTSDTNKSLLRPLLGNGLLLSEDEFWRHQREAVQPYFHYLTLDKTVDVMVVCANDVVKRWNKLIDESKDGWVDVEVHHAISELGLDIVGTGAFGTSFHDKPQEANKITTALTGALEAVRDRRLVALLPFLNGIPTESLRRMKRHCKIIYDSVTDILESRRKEKRTEIKDLLDLLLSANMPSTQLLDEAVNFLAAGAETTSNLMTWLLYAVTINPEEGQKCRQEIDRVFGQDPPTSDKLRELHYLEACAFEALRLYAPAPALNKLAIHDHYINVHFKDQPAQKVFVPKGTNFIIQAQLVHRNPDHWVNPYEYNPLRFVMFKRGEKRFHDPKVDSPEERHRYSFLGFSAGQRACLGKNFAIREIKVVLVSLLRNFEFEVVPGQKIYPDANSQAPRNGIHMRVKKRALSKAPPAPLFADDYEVCRPHVGLM